MLGIGSGVLTAFAVRERIQNRFLLLCFLIFFFFRSALGAVCDVSMLLFIVLALLTYCYFQCCALIEPVSPFILVCADTGGIISSLMFNLCRVFF